MKTIVRLCLCVCVLCAVSPMVGAADKASQETLKKLEAIIIPKVEFKQTPLSEVVAALDALALSLDKTDGSGVNLIVIDPSGNDPLVTLTLRNLSLRKILDFVVNAVGYSWNVEQGVIVIRSSGGGSSGNNLETVFIPLTTATEVRLVGPDDSAGGGGGSMFDDPFAPPSASTPFGLAMRAPGAPAPEPEPEFNTEGYDEIGENAFRSPHVAPLSTFSIDVDTASYANLRRFLTQGKRPPADAVRIEELVNYFPYDYAPPPALPGREDEAVPSEHPFAVHTEVGPAPWNPAHQLLKIGLKGYEIDWKKRPPSNLVFLLDVSGSMNASNKLSLVKKSLEVLTGRLSGDDRVAIVVYAGAAGLVLPSTTANNTRTILHAMDQLDAGGSTNGGEGVHLAYKVARENFIEGGVNRVILCTDGDFNVGITHRGGLVSFIEQQAKAGVYLTALGFGMGNYKDDMLETLSNKGNGNYAYIDNMREARKVFLHQIASNLITIAKDVKIQVEFNPAKVKGYRLIGYENRMLKAEDFNDDKKDAGEIGAGHTVTALYEIAPPESPLEVPGVDELKYQTKTAENAEAADELATVKLRYKWPDEEASRLLQQPVLAGDAALDAMPEDFRFAAAVAAFGMILRDSPHRGAATLDLVNRLAEDALGDDSGGYRMEFLDLVAAARKFSFSAPLKPQPMPAPAPLPPTRR